jgi:hypothetical protein
MRRTATAAAAEDGDNDAAALGSARRKGEARSVRGWRGETVMQLGQRRDEVATLSSCCVDASVVGRVDAPDSSRQRGFCGGGRRLGPPASRLPRWRARACRRDGQADGDRLLAEVLGLGRVEV